MKRVYWITVLVVLILAGCASVGPDYVKPAPDMPHAWRGGGEGLRYAATNDEVLSAWWQGLGDPVLVSLVERGLKNNPGLKEAVARIRQARAQRGVTNAGRYPEVDAGASARYSESSENTGGGGGSDFYSASLDASWELDLWGGVARAVEAADADIDASQEDFRDASVSLAAEIALNYMEIRTLQRRLAIAREDVSAEEDAMEIVGNRREAGLGTDLDVQEAASALAGARAQIPQLAVELESTKNSLSVLLGEHPGSVEKDLSGDVHVPVPPLETAVGVPADIIRRRPDIRRAERELAASTAEIGVATADLYPRFSLSGSLGLEALSPGDLFESSAGTYSTGAVVSWPVFRAGAIMRNIEVRNALQEQAMHRYDSTVIQALGEVESALVAYAREHERRRELQTAAEAAKEALSLREILYKSGLADYQSVVISRQNYYGLEDRLAQSEATVTENLVRLYKALGGGWRPMAEYNDSGARETTAMEGANMEGEHGN